MTYDIQLDANHKYTVDGRSAPGVNEILKAAGIGYSAESDEGYEIPEEIRDAARERGTLIHQCCHYLAEGDLDWDSVPDEAIPYVECYEDFVQQEGFVCIESEKFVYSPDGDYCGTFDQRGMISWDEWIIDLKTSTVGLKPWHALQLAAYSHAISPGKPLRRGVLEFKPNGKRKRYRLREIESDFEWDLSVFMAARRIMTWRDLNGK